MNEELYGLLGIDPEKLRQQQLQSGLLSAGLQLLAGSGYSPVRRTTGELLGQAGAAGMGAYQQSGESAIDRALRSMQIQQMAAEMQTKKAQQQALLEYAGIPSAEQALAGGGGPTVANAAKLATQPSASGRSIEILKRMASDPRLPMTERQLALKELEVVMPKPTSLDPASLYALSQGFDPQKLTPDQAKQVLAETKKLTPEQLIALGRFSFETGMSVPGMQPQAPTTGIAPRQVATEVQAPVAPGVAVPSSSFSPTVRDTPNLSPQKRQELQAKLTEVKPKILAGSISLLEQLNDKANTAKKLLNDEAALDAITGRLGKIAVETGLSTAAADANLLLQNIKSRQFVGTIQQMRQDNPTGAAVGNVAIPEMESLSNIEAGMAVGQSKAQLKQQLNQVIAGSERAKNKLVDAFKRDYNEDLPIPKSIVSTRPPGSKQIPQSAIDYLRANPRLRKEFDDYYGAGSADFVLGQ